MYGSVSEGCHNGARRGISGLTGRHNRARVTPNALSSLSSKEMIVPTSSKQPSRLPTKPRGKQLVKASSPSSQPFLRFYHSKSLRAKTLTVLTNLEKAKDSTKYRDALADIVEELTDSGMEYYFLRPLKLAEAGFFTEQSAKLGMAATTRILASVIHTIVGRMDSSQLLTVCSHIRQLME
jgi:hypothetical protein